MQHRSSLRFIFGVGSLLLGVALLFPAAVLLNLRLRLFPVSWGITDIRLHGIPISNTMAECTLGILGILLLLSGLVILCKGRETLTLESVASVQCESSVEAFGE